MNVNNEWPLMNGNNEWNLFTFIALIDILINEVLQIFIMTTTKEKNEIMYKNIIEHGKDLKRVFNLDSSIDEIKLCKALFRIENKAHSIATQFCNYGCEDEKQQEKIIDDILNKVDKLLNFKSYKRPKIS